MGLKETPFYYFYMTIIAKLMEGTTAYRQQSYTQMRHVGEGWERLLTRYFEKKGIVAVRYEQDFIQIPEPIDLKLYSKFQRDLYIIHPVTGKRLNIEVKSRNSPFQYSTVDVGKCSTWDVKKYPVHYLVVIDQNTGDTRVCQADSLTRKCEWKRRKSNDICYTVPLEQLGHIDALIDFWKAQEGEIDL